MEKLPAGQQQQIRKMGDDRLRTKLVAYGYAEELVWSWEREELMERFAQVMLAGDKSKEPSMVDPEVEKQRLVDPEVEKQGLAFEMKKWEQEVEMEKQKMEMEEKQREIQRLEKEKQVEMEKERIAVEKEKIEFKKKKAEAQHQQWRKDRRKDSARKWPIRKGARMT